MANGATVATAYYQLIPSLDGAQKDIAKELVPASEKASGKAGESGGKKLGSTMMKAFAAIGVAKVLADGLNAGFEKEFATGKLAAALNLDSKQTKTAGEVAGELYSAGFGENMAGVASLLRL